MNTSGIEPTEFNVLVKPESVEEKTAGGIILADETRDRKQAMAQKCTLVDVSPLAFDYAEWGDAEPPHIGDLVYIAKASGVPVEGKDGETYRLIKDKDIIAIMRTDDGKIAALDADIARLNAEAS